MRRLALLMTGCLFLSATCLVAQTVAPVDEPLATCESLHKSKSAIFGFHLAQLNEAQIDAKTKEMAAFWKQAEAAGPAGVNCIQQFLQAETADHYFQFDAASWLFSRDKSPQTLELVRASIASTDLQETDPANYLSLALALSREGVDVSALADRFLHSPHIVIQIPEHALDLDADTSALFLYGSMAPAAATAALLPELQAADLPVRSAAAHLLAEQMTEESYRALAHWDGVPKIQEEFRRNDIQAILKYQPPKESELAQPKFTREQVLKAIAALPHTRQEFDQRMRTQGAAFDEQMREKHATQADIDKAVAESEPIYGIAVHTTFLGSAIATLQPADFETIREARRKSLYDISDESLEEYLAFTRLMIGLINRLDLYKEYRTH